MLDFAILRRLIATTLSCAFVMAAAAPATAREPTLVKDIRIGGRGSQPHGLTKAGGMLYFVADDGHHGAEPWRSDGTKRGTRIVADLGGPGHGQGYEFQGMRGTVVFDVPGKGLHVTVGPKTNAFALGISGRFLTRLGDHIYFEHDRPPRPPDVDSSGLWQTDGTEDGTGEVEAEADGELAVLAGTLYSLRGDGLWTSDGSPRGTELLTALDITSCGCGLDPPFSLMRAGDRLFFVADDGVHGAELWTTDGTAAGTRMVRDIRRGSRGSIPRGLTSYKGKVYFNARTTAAGKELWVSDGTSAGTRLVKDIKRGPGDSDPQALATGAGRLFFAAQTRVGGRKLGIELWATDGTRAGTRLVKDIARGYQRSYPWAITRVGRKVFFGATDGRSGRELWESDGTRAGTRLVEDILPGSGDSDPTGLVNVGGTLFFAAQGGGKGEELWKYTP